MSEPATMFDDVPPPEPEQPKKRGPGRPPKKPVPYAPMDESGLLTRKDDVALSAELVKDISSDDEPACYTNEQFYRYQKDTGIWTERDWHEIRRKAMAYSGKLYIKEVTGEGDNRRVKTGVLELSDGKVDGMCNCAATRIATPQYFDDAVPGVAFTNGFYRVVSGHYELIDHSPANRARAFYDWPYREHHHEAWTDFLHNIFRGSPDATERIRALQEFFGLCILGLAPMFTKSLLLVGLGANGKSVLLNVIAELFPERLKTSMAPDTWANEYYRAKLESVYINIVQEMPEREVIESDAVKAVIDGNTVNGRHPKGQPFFFKPKAGHVFAANALPPVNDFSPGFWRRWVIIPFERNYEHDPERKDKMVMHAQLTRELPGICMWAIAGAQRIIAAGRYTMVPSGEAMIHKWRTKTDMVAMFIAERCKPVKLAKLGTGTVRLYKTFQEWCLSTGHKHPLTQNKFMDRLDLLGYKTDGTAFGLRSLELFDHTDVGAARNGEEDENESFLS